MAVSIPLAIDIPLNAMVVFGFGREFLVWVLRKRKWDLVRHWNDDAMATVTCTSILLTSFVVYGYFTLPFAVAALFVLLLSSLQMLRRQFNTHAMILNRLQKKEILPVLPYGFEAESKEEIVAAVVFTTLFTILSLYVHDAHLLDLQRFLDAWQSYMK